MTDTVLEHFRETGALLEGHFLLSSGRHSDRYLQCARVLMYPDRAEKLCREVARRYSGPAPSIVIGPALGGVVFAYEMARALSVPAIFAERDGTAFSLRRGFSVGAGDVVLVAEDVVTTGKSVREVIDLVTSRGASCAGVVSLVQRAPTNPFDVPLTALVKVDFDTWTPEECPLCREGKPLVKPGSRPGLGGERVGCRA